MAQIRQSFGRHFDLRETGVMPNPRNGKPPGFQEAFPRFDLLEFLGCDLVEVSPPYDTTGNTALLAANLLFEMLCSLPGCKRR